MISPDVIPEKLLQHMAHGFDVSPLTMCWCEFYYGARASLFSSYHLREETDILRSAICTGAKTAPEFDWKCVDQSKIILKVPFGLRTI